MEPCTLPARLATAAATAVATAAATATAAAAATAAESTTAAAAATAATEPAATTAATRRRTRLIHRKATTVELGVVELLDRRARGIFCFHFDECESTCAAGGLIAHDAHRRDRTGLGEERFERRFFSGER